MIYGIGTDILAVKRIETLYKKYGEALPRRILSPIEILEFANEFNKNREAATHFLAKRFSAKEAFSKAVGTGIREPVSMQNISISHNASGKPEFLFEAPLQQWLEQKNIRYVHLSLSDEKDYISAFAIAESA